MGAVIGALLGGAATLWGYKKYKWLRVYCIGLALCGLSFLAWFLLRYGTKTYALKVWAEVIGHYGKNVEESEVGLSLGTTENIEKVDISISRKSHLYIRNIVPLFGSDCTPEPLNPFPSESFTFQGADGSSLAITNDDLARQHMQINGSPLWKINCKTLSKDAPNKLQLYVKGNAATDCLVVAAKYEPILSSGREIVEVKMQIPIKSAESPHGPLCGN